MRRAGNSGTRLDTALLGLCLLFSLLLKWSDAGVRTGLAGFLRQTVLSPFFAMQESSEKWRTAIRSYDSIIASRDSALVLALNVPALQAENLQLQSLLLLGSRLRWGFLPARVLYQPSLVRPTTVTITAGSDHGVQVLSPVVNEDGLVGVVQTVDARTSIVSLWTNPDFAAGAMSEDGEAFGIVAPRLTGAGAVETEESTSGYLLELRNVQFRSTLEPGTRIVAAGTPGAVYPAMVPIGTVIAELEGGSGWSRTYLVRPAVQPQDLSAVIVMIPDRAAAGGGAGWQSGTALDSVAAVIAARGDSLARVRYLAEVKARSDSSLAALRARGLPPDSSGEGSLNPAGRPPASGGGGGRAGTARTDTLSTWPSVR